MHMKRAILFFVFLLFSFPIFSQVRNLGTSANALTASGNWPCLWADPTIGNGSTNGTILFLRQGIGPDTGAASNGRIFYDLSVDNGLTFDTSHGPVYDPTLSTIYNPSYGRCPMGALYNPSFSTLASDAYLTYSNSTLNNTNPGDFQQYPWGGAASGSYKLNMTALPTQHEWASDSVAEIWFYTPESFHMCKTGQTFTLYKSCYGKGDLYGRGNAYDYTENLILKKDVWDSTTHDFISTFQLVHDPAGDVPAYKWNDILPGFNTAPVKGFCSAKIVFDDSGQTGYIVSKKFLNIWDSPDTTVRLYIQKTTDGGATWNNIYLPDVDEIDGLCADSGFSMGFNKRTTFDVALDRNGYLHILLPIGTKYMTLLGTRVYYYGSYGGMFDLKVPPFGQMWKGHKLTPNSLHSIEGVMGDPAVALNRLEYDSRPQITRSYDGSKLFFSWFETDTLNWPPHPANGAYKNQNPDMHLVGYDIASNFWTPEYNFTIAPALGSAADGTCYLGGVSYYALDVLGGHKIPTVIGIPQATATNNNPDYIQPFHFKFLDGIEVNNSQFIIAPVLYGSGPNPNEIMSFVAPGIAPVPSIQLTISDLQPNPATDRTMLTISLSQPSDVLIECRSLLGQVVFSSGIKKFSAGTNRYTFDTSSLSAGVYFCTVSSKGVQSTKKLLVR